MRMYNLYAVVSGYDSDLETELVEFSVTWYDEDQDLTFVQDKEDGEVYVFSGWVNTATHFGSFDTLKEAWREAHLLFIDALVIK